MAGSFGVVSVSVSLSLTNSKAWGASTSNLQFLAALEPPTRDCEPHCLPSTPRSRGRTTEGWQMQTEPFQGRSCRLVL